jgi:hypothetical protein
MVTVRIYNTYLVKGRKQCCPLAPFFISPKYRPRALKSVELRMLAKFGKPHFSTRVFWWNGTYTSRNSCGTIVILHLSLKDSGAQILDAGSLWLLSSLEWRPVCMYGFSVWNLVHSVQFAPRILRWCLDFWEIRVSLVSVHGSC